MTVFINIDRKYSKLGCRYFHDFVCLIKKYEPGMARHFSVDNIKKSSTS